jgi:transcriptional regulator GlxA family with amidase domain
MRPPKPRRIVIAAYEGVSLLDLAGPLEAFQVASSFGGSRDSRVTYECSVVSIRGGPVKTANGVALVTESVRSLGRDPIDTLIVPGAFAVEDVTRDRGLVRWVGKKADTCRRVCSVCIGSFLLAAAGVLDGRRAATHWLHAPLLAVRHPRVTVELDAIFVRDGAVLVVGGRNYGNRSGARLDRAGRRAWSRDECRTYPGRLPETGRRAVAVQCTACCPSGIRLRVIRRIGTLDSGTSEERPHGSG